MLEPLHWRPTRSKAIREMSCWAVKGSQNSGESCWARTKTHLERNKNKFPEKSTCSLPSELDYFQEVLLSEEDSDFWQITERKREAKDLTILHRSSGWGWEAERSLISQPEDSDHIA